MLIMNIIHSTLHHLSSINYVYINIYVCVYNIYDKHNVLNLRLQKFYFRFGNVYFKIFVQVFPFNGIVKRLVILRGYIIVT